MPRPAASAASPLRDPFGPASGSERGIRGGSFINAPHNLRSGNREHGDPDRGSIYYGFRCARRLP